MAVDAWCAIVTKCKPRTIIELLESVLRCQLTVQFNSVVMKGPFCDPQPHLHFSHNFI